MPEKLSTSAAFSPKSETVSFLLLEKAMKLTFLLCSALSVSLVTTIFSQEKLEKLSMNEVEQLKEHVEQFLSDPSNPHLKNPHTYVGLSGNLLVHEELLDFAQEIVERGCGVLLHFESAKDEPRSRINV